MFSPDISVGMSGHVYVSLRIYLLFYPKVFFEKKQLPLGMNCWLSNLIHYEKSYTTYILFNIFVSQGAK